MPREKLLFGTISQNKLERITKMQNLSQYDLDQIAKMLNLSQNELEQIAKMGRIKDYSNMSKEELLIALLKLEQSLAELQKSKYNNAKIEDTKNIFYELTKRFSKKEEMKLEKIYIKKKKLTNILNN